MTNIHHIPNVIRAQINTCNSIMFKREANVCIRWKECRFVNSDIHKSFVYFFDFPIRPIQNVESATIVCLIPMIIHVIVILPNRRGIITA